MAPTWNNLGLSYFEKGEWEDALNAYKKAIDLEWPLVNAKQPDPIAKENISFYYNNLGLAYYHLTNFDEAEKNYYNAERENPNNAEIYFNRGNVSISRDAFDLAQ